MPQKSDYLNLNPPLNKKELETLKTMSHPFILKIDQLRKDGSGYEVVYEPFQTVDFVSVILKINFAERLKVATRIASAIRYIHKLNLVHAQLRPENCVICAKTNTVKIKGYFGNWSGFNIQKKLDYLFSDTRLFWRDDFKPDLKTDSFSFGVLLMLIFDPEKSLEFRDRHSLKKAIEILKSDDRSELSINIKSSVKDLITDCLSHNIQRRPTFDEIILQLIKIKFRMHHIFIHSVPKTVEHGICACEFDRDKNYEEISKQSCVSKGCEKNDYFGDKSFRLARCFYHGKGVEKDLNKAIQYYRIAMKNGNKRASGFLGVLYHKGIGLETSLMQANECFQQAAKGGHIPSMINLVVVNRKIPTNLTKCNPLMLLIEAYYLGYQECENVILSILNDYPELINK